MENIEIPQRKSAKICLDSIHSGTRVVVMPFYVTGIGIVGSFVSFPWFPENAF